MADLCGSYVFQSKCLMGKGVRSAAWNPAIRNFSSSRVSSPVLSFALQKLVYLSQCQTDERTCPVSSRVVQSFCAELDRASSLVRPRQQIGCLRTIVPRLGWP